MVSPAWAGTVSFGAAIVHRAVPGVITVEKGSEVWEGKDSIQRS